MHEKGERNGPMVKFTVQRLLILTVKLMVSHNLSC